MDISTPIGNKHIHRFAYLDFKEGDNDIYRKNRMVRQALRLQAAGWGMTYDWVPEDCELIITNVPDMAERGRGALDGIETLSTFHPNIMTKRIDKIIDDTLAENAPVMTDRQINRYVKDHPDDDTVPQVSMACYYDLNPDKQYPYLIIDISKRGWKNGLYECDGLKLRSKTETGKALEKLKSALARARKTPEKLNEMEMEGIREIRKAIHELPLMSFDPYGDFMCWLNDFIGPRDKGKPVLLISEELSTTDEYGDAMTTRGVIYDIWHTQNVSKDFDRENALYDRRMEDTHTVSKSPDDGGGGSKDPLARLRNFRKKVETQDQKPSQGGHKNKKSPPRTR